MMPCHPKFDHNGTVGYRLAGAHSACLTVSEATAINLIQCYFYSQNGMSAPASELPYMVYCGESEHSDTSPSLSLGTVRASGQQVPVGTDDP